MSQVESSASIPIIIAGMHRSGTSLTASILQQAGVFIGEQLLKANTGNRKGHFEDEAFLSLHKDILVSCGISYDGWTARGQVDVPQQFWERAQELCDRRLAAHTIWGWKEPRTTLFLDFWQQQLPQAKFVLPYRSPWEVVDSLFTRGDPVFEHNPKFAAEVWTAYNQIILAFCQAYPDNCFLFHCDCLKVDERNFVERLRRKLGLSLPLPETPLFQPGEMHGQVNSTHRPTLLAKYFPETLAVYEQLENVADIPGTTPAASQMLTEAPAYRDWALQDWLTSNRLQAGIKTAQAQLASTTDDLQSAQAEIHHLQVALDQANSEIKHWRLTIDAMEANRFWQMRNAWVRLKETIRGGKQESP